MKESLHRYLRNHRAAVLWKLEGLGERELRLPRTPTGTNMLGLVKHLAWGEAGYFGVVFDRPGPLPTWTEDQEDPHLDLYATADESRDQVVELYRRACATPTRRSRRCLWTRSARSPGGRRSAGR